MNTLFIMFSFIMIVIILNIMTVLVIMFSQNINYHKKEMKRVKKAGYAEKNATLPDGTVIHYGESRDDEKPALLLIHGQTGSWEDYASILPKLSRFYHVFAVDCHGHGKSSKNQTKYNSKAMGEDLIWFIRNIIKSPVIVSGHSTGGLLTAWIAANAPEDVRGIVLEDPPFFSTEYDDRLIKSFAYVDLYEPIHRFLNQKEETDWAIFYLNNTERVKYVGEKKMKGMLQYAISYRRKKPNKPLQFYYLPTFINRIFLFMASYDLEFGENFYDGSWFVEFNQAEVLKRIKCPSILLHTKWSINENGILMAAMSGEDAEQAHELIEGNQLIKVACGHNPHYEIPEEFIGILKDFLNDVSEY